ncbi:Reverse transcriptase domain [Trinorchestia longiramus]|nr:Reverse transcriptase domain [Trinorchestia longiramus]
MSGFGLKVGEEKLNCFLYADDIVVVSELKQELQRMLEIVNGYSRDFKVKFGGDKSKVMVINGDETDRAREWNIGEVKFSATLVLATACFGRCPSVKMTAAVRCVKELAD